MKNFFDFMTQALEPVVEDRQKENWDMHNDAVFVVFSDADDTGVLAVGDKRNLSFMLAEALIHDERAMKIVQTAMRIAKGEVAKKPLKKEFLLKPQPKKPIN